MEPRIFSFLMTFLALHTMHKAEKSAAPAQSTRKRGGAAADTPAESSGATAPRRTTRASKRAK